MGFYSQTIRNLSNNKGYRYIKIVGLAMALTAIILVGLWVHDELSFNKCHKNYNSIAKLMRNEINKSGEIYTNYVFTTGMGTLLKSSYGSHFSKIAMVRARVESRVIASGEKKYTEKGFFMQPDGPELFSLKMVYGTLGGLKDMNSIMLSRTLARKLFGNTDPVNQIIKMDGSWDLTITGVFEDLPKNSEFTEAQYFAPLDRYLDGWANLNIWNNYNMYVYVQLKPGNDFEKTSSIIKHAIKLHDPNSTAELFLHPMRKWHLHSEFANGKMVTSNRLELLILLMSIGLFVLLLACINYMNLSTASSEHFSKEIGIRKTLGSPRFQLIKQFLTDSMFVILIAYILALFFTILILPWFNRVSGKELSILWNNAWFWLTTVVFLLVVNLLSGSYPALYLSSFTPLNALKGGAKQNRLGITTREMFVVFQFTIAIILIIASIVIFKQVQHTKNRPVGYTPKGLLSLYMNTPDYTGKFLILREELKKTGVVQEIAASNYYITETKGWNTGFSWSGKEQDFDPSFNYVRVTPEYGKTLGLEFVKGRGFSREFQTDKSGMVLNESAVKVMGLKSPIGEAINWKVDGEVKNYSIIGVVKDMVKGSPYEPTDPVIIILSEGDLRCLYIRINPSLSASNALPKIEEVFKRIVPMSPFNYSFVDELYNSKFEEEERTGNMAVFLTLLAIAISCLGLFGFAAFIAERRTKEIGVRRVNGAKVFEILRMLNQDFIIWIAIAFVIACPIAWYAMNSWLQNFAYRTELNWWVFAFAGLLTLFIALITVSWQAWRAATRNPVEALRYE